MEIEKQTFRYVPIKEVELDKLENKVYMVILTNGKEDRGLSQWILNYKYGITHILLPVEQSDSAKQHENSIDLIDQYLKEVNYNNISISEIRDRFFKECHADGILIKSSDQIFEWFQPFLNPENVFRDFLRTNHLTSKWETYLEQRNGNVYPTENLIPIDVSKEAIEFAEWIVKNGIRDSAAEGMWLIMEEGSYENIKQRISSKQLYKLFKEVK